MILERLLKRSWPTRYNPPGHLPNAGTEVGGKIRRFNIPRTPIRMNPYSFSVAGRKGTKSQPIEPINSEGAELVLYRQNKSLIQGPRV